MSNKTFVVPEGIKEISPDGYAVIRKRKRFSKDSEFRVSVYAENGKMLHDSKQWFANIAIAQENILQTLKAFSGIKIFVILGKGIEGHNFFLFNDGSREMI